MNNRPASIAIHGSEWRLSAAVAIACGIAYLAARPPIFDSDGYSDLLSALGPNRMENIDPLHLLSVPIQILLVTVFGARPYPPTAPFEAVGVILNCATLFFFCALLLKSSGNTLFAVAASLFVAFSPKFWYVGFQNKPYPLLFLALVLCLGAWRTADGAPPSGLRLAVSSVCLSVGILIHQAAVFLVPAGLVTLIVCGHEPLKRRLIRAALWSGSTATIVLAVYLYAWWLVTSGDSSFLDWAAQNLISQGPLQFQFPVTLIQSVMGASGAVLQDDALRSLLDSTLSAHLIFAGYAGLGVAFLLALAWWVRSTRSNGKLLSLLQSNSLFVLSLLIVLFWSAIVVLWEPVTSNHWVLDLFPALVCLGLGLRRRTWQNVSAFAAIALVLSGLNIYLNRLDDRDASRNAPERLVATIDRHLGSKDVFIVLANEDWYGDVEYELLFRYMKVASDPRGIAILNDFVLPAKTAQSWQGSFDDKIRATLGSGGKVYVAASVLDPDSYRDLANSEDAFSEKLDATDRAYGALDGAALLKGVKKVLNSYLLQDSDLKLVDEEFLVIQPPDHEQ